MPPEVKTHPNFFHPQPMTTTRIWTMPIPTISCGLFFISHTLTQFLVLVFLPSFWFKTNCPLRTCSVIYGQSRTLDAISELTWLDLGSGVTPAGGTKNSILHAPSTSLVLNLLETTLHTATSPFCVVQWNRRTNMHKQWASRANKDLTTTLGSRWCIGQQDFQTWSGGCSVFCWDGNKTR